MSIQTLSAAIVCTVAGILLGSLLETSCVPRGTQIVHDTVTHVVPGERVYVEGPARVRYVRDTVRINGTVVEHDTVYTTAPFVATLDTLINQDTISLAYRFPQHAFAIDLRSAPDTLRVPMPVRIIEDHKRPVWLDVLTHVGAAALGYAIGR